MLISFNIKCVFWWVDTSLSVYTEEEWTASLKENYLSHDDEIAELRSHVQFLEAQITRNNISREKMLYSIEDLKARSMRENISSHLI